MPTFNPFSRLHQKFATPARVNAYIESLAGEGGGITDPLDVNNVEILDPNNDGVGTVQGAPCKLIIHQANALVSWLVGLVNDTAGQALGTGAYVADDGSFNFTAGKDINFGTVDASGSITFTSGAGNGAQLVVDATGNIHIAGATSFYCQSATVTLGLDDAPWNKTYTNDLVMKSGAASIIILPVADPHVVGALWNSSGTITISAG